MHATLFYRCVLANNSETLHNAYCSTGMPTAFRATPLMFQNTTWNLVVDNPVTLPLFLATVALLGVLNELHRI